MNEDPPGSVLAAFALQGIAAAAWLAALPAVPGGLAKSLLVAGGLLAATQAAIILLRPSPARIECALAAGAQGVLAAALGFVAGWTPSVLVPAIFGWFAGGLLLVLLPTPAMRRWFVAPGDWTPRAAFEFYRNASHGLRR